MPPLPHNGFVSLVGAGPGDPGLLTVKALSRLRRADTVAYDRLVNPALLRECRADADPLYAAQPGERAGRPPPGRPHCGHTRQRLAGRWSRRRSLARRRDGRVRPLQS